MTAHPTYYSAGHCRHWWLAWLLAVLAAGPAAGATCTVAITGVAFGNYDFLSAAPQDGVGTLSITCDAGIPYTIALSSGDAGNYLNRSMLSGAHPLTYNLYTDSNHLMVWGDGTSGTMTVNGTGNGPTSVSHSIYGRIPAGQNPYAGSYADAITVTITY